MLVRYPCPNFEVNGCGTGLKASLDIVLSEVSKKKLTIISRWKSIRYFYMKENSYKNWVWKTQIWNKARNVIQGHKHLKGGMKVMG